MENKENKFVSDLTDEPYEELLNTIISLSKCEKNKIYSDVRTSIFEDENKNKTKQEKEKEKDKNTQDNNKLDCIKIEDYNADDIFLLQEKYNKIVNNNTTNINKLYIQLNEIDPYDYTRYGKPQISPSNSIENMVESTYNFDSKLKYQISEEICYLRLLSFKWRPIGGDGNCFYRSVMYSYLENLILERDITVLQRLVLEFEEKFDADYPNTKSLPKSVRDPITQIDRKLIISIFKIIISILDNTSKDETQNNKTIIEALSVLSKSFNYSKVFDTAMILFLRFKLYEFILSNKNKFFSDDFPIKLGNLLPAQYETEEGNFLYDKFFSDELLKLYTYAEKISIYLTPLVLKVNLRVIFYDYGNECNIQTKDFACFLDKNETLAILYRKAHYDIVYGKDYCDKYSKFIHYFNTKDNKLFVVDENLIEYYMKNEVEDVDLEQSKIFNKKNKKKEEGKISKNKNDNTGSTDISTTSNNVNNESVEEPIDDLNNLSKMKEKLEKELKELRLKQKNHEENYDTISSQEIKSLKCIQCNDSPINKIEEYYELPCGCYLYAKFCIAEFMKKIFSDLNLNLDKYPVKCSCGYIFSLFDLMHLVVNLEKRFELPSFKNDLNLKFKKYCMRCFTQTVSNKKIKLYIDPLFLKYLKQKHLQHHICDECDKQNSNECKICKSNHLHVLYH